MRILCFFFFFFEMLICCFPVNQNQTFVDLETSWNCPVSDFPKSNGNIRYLYGPDQAIYWFSGFTLEWMSLWSFENRGWVWVVFFFSRGRKDDKRSQSRWFCFVLKGRGFLIWSFLASAPFVFFSPWIVCSGRRVEVSLGELFWCEAMIEMIQSWETYAAPWHPKYRILLLMEGVLHHLGCRAPCKSSDKLQYLSTGAGFLPSTVWL